MDVIWVVLRCRGLTLVALLRNFCLKRWSIILRFEGKSIMFSMLLVL